MRAMDMIDKTRCGLCGEPIEILTDAVPDESIDASAPWCQRCVDEWAAFVPPEGSHLSAAADTDISIEGASR